MFYVIQTIIFSNYISKISDEGAKPLILNLFLLKINFICLIIIEMFLMSHVCHFNFGVNMSLTAIKFLYSIEKDMYFCDLSDFVTFLMQFIKENKYTKQYYIVKIFSFVYLFFQ